MKLISVLKTKNVDRLHLSGLKENSIFNIIVSFYVLQNPVFDFMHIFEVSYHYNMGHLLNYYINLKKLYYI